VCNEVPLLTATVTEFFLDDYVYSDLAHGVVLVPWPLVRNSMQL